MILQEKDMETWLTYLAFLLREWVPSLGILFSTLLGVAAARTTLKRLHRDRDWRLLQVLATPISNVICIVGMKLFADSAPLSGKLEVWISGGIYVLSVIIFLGLIQKSALAGIEWSALKTNSSELIHQGFIPLIKNVITLFVFFSGGIMILKHLNYDVMSLVTALGVSSLAVGLAAKDTLSNMISGFILIIDRNLRPGDRINLTGLVGDVLEIGLRSTRIKIGDGNILIVPNAELVNTKILNLSMPDRETTCSLLIRVSYSVSFQSVKRISLSVLKKIPQISPAKPLWINLLSLSEGHQLIQVGFWISEMNDAGTAISEFNEKILEKFALEKIVLLAPVQKTL